MENREKTDLARCDARFHQEPEGVQSRNDVIQNALTHAAIVVLIQPTIEHHLKRIFIRKKKQNKTK